MKVSVEPGKVAFDKSQKRKEAATYTGTEQPLAATKDGDMVTWQQDMPRGEKAVRDFLFGNLPLWATCHWNGEPLKGSVRVRPSAIQFFDSGKRPLSAVKSLLMEVTLFFRSRLANTEGIQVQFVYKR